MHGGRKQEILPVVGGKPGADHCGQNPDTYKKIVLSKD